MWRKWNPHALLAGMQTGAATVGSSRDVVQKVKNRTSSRLANYSPQYLYVRRTDKCGHYELNPSSVFDCSSLIALPCTELYVRGRVEWGPSDVLCLRAEIDLNLSFSRKHAGFCTQGDFDARVIHVSTIKHTKGMWLL